MAEADAMDVDAPSSSTSSGTGKKRFEVKKVRRFSRKTSYLVLVSKLYYLKL